MCRTSVCQRCGVSVTSHCQRGRMSKWCCSCKSLVRAEQHRAQRKTKSDLGHKQQCVHCGKHWLSRHPKARYCSTRCQHLASGSRVVLACQACGKDFDCSAAEMKAGRHFCSKSCMLNARRNPPRTCLGCGISFFAKVHTDPRKGKGQYCSKKCAGKARRDGRRAGRWAEGVQKWLCRARVKPSQRMYAAMRDAMRRHMDSIDSLWRAMREWRPCLHCGGPLKKHATGLTRFCSIKCCSLYEHESACCECGNVFSVTGAQGKASLCGKCRKRKNRIYRNQHGRNIRKRAIKYGVLRVKYRRRELLDRDKWLCQLCGVQLNKKWKTNGVNRVPHSCNATLDHIVPMCVGGDDAPWNIQACCFRCNSRKSKSSKGQLRLRF